MTYKHVRTVNLAREAEETARRQQATQTADKKVDMKLKIMLIGIQGKQKGVRNDTTVSGN